MSTPGQPAGASAQDLPVLSASRRQPACIVIASYNGQGHVGSAVARARGQCPVFVVSDGSTDRTAEEARTAGATVLELAENVGKPSAIFQALRHFAVADRFETCAIVDDDTTLADDFIARALNKMSAGVAIVVGNTHSDWADAVRWNPWVANRAFSYWRYQLFIRRGQSLFNVINSIAGSNSLFRTSTLMQVVTEDTPYIVDDTYWTLETHRRGLGRIVYAPRARAWVQDPTTMRAWYGQNLRWLWGTMQGIRGHKVGRRLSGFDLAYLGLMFDWFSYVAGWPLVLVLSAWVTRISIGRLFVFYAAGFFVWAVIGSIALRKWRLVPLFPAMMLFDWITRANFVHAIYLAARYPTVESCRWISPDRYESAETPPVLDPAFDGRPERAVEAMRTALIGSVLDQLDDVAPVDLCAYLHAPGGERPRLYLRSPARRSLRPRELCELHEALLTLVGAVDVDRLELTEGTFHGLAVRTRGPDSSGVYVLGRRDGRLSDGEMTLMTDWCRSVGPAVHHLDSDRAAARGTPPRETTRTDDGLGPDGSGPDEIGPRSRTVMRHVAAAVAEASAGTIGLLTLAEHRYGPRRYGVVVLEGHDAAVVVDAAVTCGPPGSAIALAAERGVPRLVHRLEHEECRA